MPTYRWCSVTEFPECRCFLFLFHSTQNDTALGGKGALRIHLANNCHHPYLLPTTPPQNGFVNNTGLQRIRPERGYFGRRGPDLAATIFSMGLSTCERKRTHMRDVAQV